MSDAGRLVDIGDTKLYVVERGAGYPLMLLHGGPGLDHRMFGDYLDSLSERFKLLFVDQRSQGLSERAPKETWTLQHMAADVVWLAHALDLEEYAVIGHSYGAFVALQNAVDFPGSAAYTVVSGGLPSSVYLQDKDRNLETFKPIELREQVTRSWERETDVQAQDEMVELLHDQNPFHFADPHDPRIAEYERRTEGAHYAPDVLRHFAAADYGGIEVEHRLPKITQPVLIMAGRYDRTCSVRGSEVMAELIPNAQLVVFENSGHMTFVEENQSYLGALRAFLP